MRCNSRKRTKTLVWTQIDRCVFDDNENAYFWKRVSVGRALEQQCLEKNWKRVSVYGALGPRCESSLVTSPLSSVHFDVTVLATQVRSLLYGSLYSCCCCLAVASLEQGDPPSWSFSSVTGHLATNEVATKKSTFRQPTRHQVISL